MLFLKSPMEEKMNEIATGILRKLFVNFAVIIKFCIQKVYKALKNNSNKIVHVIISDFKLRRF